jgi:hypothetical protein
MSLTPEQTQAVASWVAAGDTLSAVQRKLVEHFKLSLTYRDVRFLVDDLDLALKDAAPKVDASDVTKAQPPPARKAAPAPTSEAAADEDDISADAPLPDEDELDAPPAGAGNVTVEVDAVTLLPGALASGSVTFSDGVTGKWVVDQYGRPGFTEVSQPGYRPKPTDAQAFMQQLGAALQQRGML